MNDLHHPCEPWAEQISLAAAGCLSPGEQREVHLHIETCSNCRERFRQLTELCGVLSEAGLPAVGTEATIVERVMSVVTADDPRQPLRATAGLSSSAENTVGQANRGTHQPTAGRTLTTWRWIMRSPVSRVAAAVVFVLAVAGVALWFHGAGTTPAFANFIQPILEAKTVKFKQTVDMRGPPATTLESKWMVLDATRLRMEVNAPHGLESIQITDWSKGESLSLYPATKHATIVEYADAKNARTDPSWWLRLLQMARDNKTKNMRCEPLGEKQLEGRRVMGFRISADHSPPLDLWGDPETGLPVRVEMTTGIDGNIKVTMSDFVFNAKMDEALFSVEPPAGYTVDHRKADTAPDEEKDLIEMFRQYAKLTGGAFPKSLDFRTVTWVFWKTYNIQSMWDNIMIVPGIVNANKGQRKKFEEQIGKIMDKMNEASMAGKANEEKTREFAAQMSKIVSETTYPALIQMTWESFAPASLKANADAKHKFEKQMRKIMEGDPNKGGEEILKIANRLLWEEVAPVTLKANEEKRHKFEELVRTMAEKPNHKQEVKAQFRKVFGDQMLKDVEAWELQVEKSAKARGVGTQKSVKDQEAKSREFMEAQRQIGRGLEFANHLRPASDAHYAGKGVSLGAADTPIFWYRPKDAKKYRVIYADLSVRDADAPPNVPKAQPAPAQASPEK